MSHGLRAWLAVSACLLGALTAPGMAAGPAANGTAAASAVVGLIIDDLGDRLADGRRAIALPGAVTYAILPQTTYSRRLAEMAHARGKEVMLHQPMQAINGKAMGPGGMGMEMSHNALLATLEANLASVPHARGVNNHMGSRLTQDPEKMAWVMRGLQQHGNLYFLDSRTVDTSRAMQVAIQAGLPTATRDVFLDHNRDQKFMQRQWRYLQRLARENGSAVCIAHPYPESLQFLRDNIPSLKQNGIQLMRVSELIEWREDKERRKLAWQTSTSLSR